MLSILLYHLSLLPTSFDRFISFFVDHVLPLSNPSSFEYQIIRFYLSFILLSSIPFLLLSSILSKPHPDPIHSDLSLPLDHQRAIVDIYIDLNHFDPLLQPQLSIESLLDRFRSIVHRSLQPSSPPPASNPFKLVYWCYIDRDRPQLVDWISQLDKLETHYPHGFVQILDTCHPSIKRSSKKPLLHDLLKILSTSPTDRLHVISTADPGIRTAGIDLIKLHPNPSILAYIPPLGTSMDLTESNAPNVDHLFRWENRDEIVPLEEFKPRARHLPSKPEDHQEFQPLILIFKALTQTCVDLETIKDYLKPWYSDLTRSEDDPDQAIMKFIHSALIAGIISLSSQHSTVDQTDPSLTWVHLQDPVLKRSSHSKSTTSMTEKLDPLAIDRSELDEDTCTTTTGSDVGKSEPSSPDQLNDTRLPDLPDRPQLLPGGHRQKDPNRALAPLGNLIKHKHEPPSLEHNLAIDRPVKKKRNELESISRAIPRLTSGNLRKRNLRKRSPRSLIVIDLNPVICPQSLTSPNLDHPPAPSSKHLNHSNNHVVSVNRVQDQFSHEGIPNSSKPHYHQRNHEKPCSETLTGPYASRNDPIDERLDDRTSKLRQAASLVRSTLWINCSTGIAFINNTSDSRFRRFDHPIRDDWDVPQRIPPPSTTIKLVDLERRLIDERNERHGGREEGSMREDENRLMSVAHQHFKRLLIPAIANLFSPPQHDSPLPHSTRQALRHRDHSYHCHYPPENLEVIVVDRHRIQSVQSFGLNDVD